MGNTNLPQMAETTSENTTDIVNVEMAWLSKGYWMLKVSEKHKMEFWSV
jgi:hypothetical protein